MQAVDGLFCTEITNCATLFGFTLAFGLKVAKSSPDHLAAPGCDRYRYHRVKLQTRRANRFASRSHLWLVPGAGWVVVGGDSFEKSFLKSQVSPVVRIVPPRISLTILMFSSDGG